MDVRREFRFEAAHRLPTVDPTHKCARLHGHSYRLIVTVSGEVAPETGMVIDFAQIDEIVDPIIDESLDHRYLNEVDGLENPTSESVAKWVWKRLAERLPGLSAVEIAETCTSAVVYRGD
jgi:6-pyruvoyltetrahydropterin/6-carboxytetrahydropterin synthase